VNSYDSSQSNATSVTGVTCVELRAAISSVPHRESAVFWVRKADTLGEDVGLLFFLIPIPDQLPFSIFLNSQFSPA
jgi:hypothetical protein